MQKSIFGIYALLLLFAFSFTACDKEQVDPIVEEDNITSEEDLATVSNLYQDTEDEVDLQIEARLNGDPDTTGCPTVTFAQPKGTFPNTITIDFGVDGCVGPNGRVRKGKIVVQQSAELYQPGAMRTITPVGFSIDDVQIEGDKVWVNNGRNSAGQMFWTRTVDAKFYFPNGDLAKWEANHTVTMIEGSTTLPLIDNVLEITGGSTGINRKGTHFEGKILIPLIKRKTCRWVESGERGVTANGKTRTLNYGDGSCEPFALVTFDNGTTKQIILKKWW